MANVLIVEDNEDTLVVLKEVILNEFVDWTIDTAATVTEARAKLTAAEQPYDFAVLDFRVPSSKDEGDGEGDLTLCHLIRQQTPATRVIHITAYTGDKALENHLMDERRRDSYHDHVIGKDTTNWMERVRNLLRAFVHGDRIQQKVEALLPSISYPPGSRAPYRDPVRGGSVTNRVIDVCADTRLHWKFLTPAMRDRIRELLSVDDSNPEDVRVSLIGEAPEE
jgi:CheY-like chemotaxis protein